MLVFLLTKVISFHTSLIAEHLSAIEKSGLFDIKAVYSPSKKSAEALIPNGSVDVYSDDSGREKV